ncbi:MAG: cell division protein FtsL [Deltaproteobacteria bacterium]|nr:cell division protein FtsL [Deltaproteobacteria bacterium]MCB9787864.1 cell division protein FtsL [Deltaproteobacteria bacterium]
MSPPRKKGSATRQLGWRSGRFAALMLLTMGVAGAGLYQVRARFEIVRLGYAVDAQRFEHRRLLEQQKRLRLSLATFEDPRQVESYARQHLDMHEATERDELIVPDGATVEAVPMAKARLLVSPDEAEAVSVPAPVPPGPAEGVTP